MNVPNVRIERLRLNSGQVDEICQMLADFYDNDYEEEMINEDNKNIDRHSFVALTNANAVAGFILVHMPRRHPLIVQFLVAQQFRGQRLGFRLLRRAIEDINEYAETMDERTKYLKIYLDVPISAAAAIALYENNGFRRSSGRAKNIGVTAHRMERKIT